MENEENETTKVESKVVTSIPEHWNFDQERLHAENLANQRFNFFLVVYGLILTAVASTEKSDERSFIISIGLLLCVLLWVPLCRSFGAVDILLKKLQSIPGHPQAWVKTESQTRAKIGWIKSNLIMQIFIPLVCCLSLAYCLISYLVNPKAQH